MTHKILEEFFVTWQSGSPLLTQKDNRQTILFIPKEEDWSALTDLQTGHTGANLNPVYEVFQQLDSDRRLFLGCIYRSKEHTLPYPAIFACAPPGNGVGITRLEVRPYMETNEAVDTASILEITCDPELTPAQSAKQVMNAWLGSKYHNHTALKLAQRRLSSTDLEAIRDGTYSLSSSGDYVSDLWLSLIEEQADGAIALAPLQYEKIDNARFDIRVHVDTTNSVELDADRTVFLGLKSPHFRAGQSATKETGFVIELEFPSIGSSDQTREEKAQIIARQLANLHVMQANVRELGNAHLNDIMSRALKTNTPPGVSMIDALEDTSLIIDCIGRYRANMVLLMASIWWQVDANYDPLFEELFSERSENSPQGIYNYYSDLYEAEWDDVVAAARDAFEMLSVSLEGDEGSDEVYQANLCETVISHFIKMTNGREIALDLLIDALLNQGSTVAQHIMAVGKPHDGAQRSIRVRLTARRICQMDAFFFLDRVGGISQDRSDTDILPASFTFSKQGLGAVDDDTPFSIEDGQCIIYCPTTGPQLYSPTASHDMARTPFAAVVSLAQKRNSEFKRAFGATPVRNTSPQQAGWHTNWLGSQYRPDVTLFDRLYKAFNLFMREGKRASHEPLQGDFAGFMALDPGLSDDIHARFINSNHTIQDMMADRFSIFIEKMCGVKDASGKLGWQELPFLYHRNATRTEMQAEKFEKLLNYLSPSAKHAVGLDASILRSRALQPYLDYANL